MDGKGGEANLKLLLVTFDPPQNVGGVEGRANYYTKCLRDLGHTVDVISFSPDGSYSREELHGAPLWRFPSSSRSAFKALRRTRNIIRSESLNSVFLLSGAITFYGALLLGYARLTGIETVSFYYGKDILTSRKKSISSRFFLWISPKLSRTIAVNSNYTASLLPKRYAKKTKLLYPAVDPSALNAVSEAPQKKSAAEPGGSYVLLFVGRLVKRKGVDDLLNAFKILFDKLPDSSSLEIVGDGPELENLQARACELGIEERVKFYGKLTGDRLYERYARCSVFVMPSKTTETDVEGFGTVFLEAGLFGKPSVGTFSGGIPEAVIDGETGLLVPEGDVGLLSSALERLFIYPDLRLRLGNAAKERVFSQFTWDKSSKTLISFFSERGM